MMIMRDAEQQERLEEERALEPPIPPIELDEDASLEDRMKARLSELLHKNPENEEDNLELIVLLEMLEDDDNPEDDIFKGKHGDYTIGDGFVYSDVFKEGTENDSPENINGVLELASLAKASLHDDVVYFNGSNDNPEQLAMHAYAAELTGLNVGNLDDVPELSADIKQKMDAAWSEMNGGTAPELTPEPGNELTQDPDVVVDQPLVNSLNM